MILRFILIVIAFSMVSCLELPDLKDHDGAPTSVTEIYGKLVSAWGEDPVTHDFKDKFDGAEINMNEAVYLSKTFEIVGSAPKEYEALSLKTHAVLDSVDESGAPVRDFRMLYLSTQRTDANQKPFPSEVSYIFAKSAPSPLSITHNLTGKEYISKDFVPAKFLTTYSDLQQLSSSNPPLSVHNMLSAVYNCLPVPAEGWNPTCYNLRTWSSIEPAPFFMQTDPGCGGLINCQMHVNHLAYDLVTDVRDEETGSRVRAKTLIHLQISPDLPYLSRVTKFCFQGLGKYQGTPYAASVCTEVTKFERGTPR